MNRFYLSSILFILYFNCRSQEANPFEFTLSENNNIEVKIDTISFAEFPSHAKPLKWIEPKVNESKDSIYKALRLKFSNSFEDSLSCLILNGIKENRVLCIDTSYLIDPKSWVTYSLYDYNLNFIFFHISYYEGEEYILFDPEKRIIKSIWNYPTFIDKKAIFSVTDYNALEGSSSFEFQSLEKDDSFSFYVNEWDISNFYYSINKFYFEFTPSHKKISKKYIRLTIQKI